MLKIRYYIPVVVLLLLFSALYADAQPARPNMNRQRSFDAEHYIIRTSFDRMNKLINGETTITLSPIKRDFNIVELDSDGLKFEKIILLPGEIDLKWKLDGDRVFVHLNNYYQPGDKVRIRLNYSSRPKKGVYFIDALIKDGKVLRPPHIWSQGQAAETRHWFPSYDFPDDKATTEQYLTVQKGETAIANGELKSIADNGDGTETFHFNMPAPHSIYLTSFVVGTYSKLEEEYAGIPLGYFVYPNRFRVVPKAYVRTQEMMKIFEQLTGISYPYNKYDQTIVGGFSFGGMENITATTMADTEILRAELAADIRDIEDLVSHELAHSWFGNLVTCKNWAELWLNEGFATFMEAAFREKRFGRADYIRKIKEDVNIYFAEDSYKKYPHGLFNALADERVDDSIFNSTTYQKGSAVIHMLRETVGEEAFWKAINIYLKRHEYGNVETKDLQEVMEKASGSDLDWFFDQWVYGAGYPKLEIRQQYNTRNRMLEITVSQTHKSDRLIPDVFRLPIEIEINTAEGKKIENVTLNKRENRFTFFIADKPTSIVLDKHEKVAVKKVKLHNLTVK